MDKANSGDALPSAPTTRKATTKGSVPATGASAGGTAVIRNPYARSQRGSRGGSGTAATGVGGVAGTPTDPPALFHPSDAGAGARANGTKHDGSDGGGNNGGSQTTALDSKPREPHALATARIGSALPERAVRGAASSASEPPRQWKQQQHQKQQRREPSQDLAFWERLPTQTISLRPAEVLTVNECLRCGNTSGRDNDKDILCRNGKRKQPWHVDPRQNHRGGQNQRDRDSSPLRPPPSSSPARYNIAKLYCDQGRPVRVTGIVESRSFVPLSANVDASGNPCAGASLVVDDETMLVELNLRDPLPQRASESVGTTTKHATAPGGSSSLAAPRRRTRRRPWFAGGQRDAKRGTVPVGSTGARTPTTPVLAVLVDPSVVPRLDAATVGSFVTVIGTFFPAGREGQGPPRDGVYKLEARTVHVVSSQATTDMVLYETALKRRRAAMYRRHCAGARGDPSSSAADADATDAARNDPPELLQGCGPPPYDALGSPR